jgi:hypothetical protein
MIDLFPPLDTAFRSIAVDLKNWFSDFPEDAVWNIVSDYCIGDRNKKNDAIAFSIVANHDRMENIREYIAAVAPRDIKSSRQIPLGLMQYLRCPVAFSVTYIVPRDSALLRDYISVENMREFPPDIETFLRSVQVASPVTSEYFDAVYARFQRFTRDIRENKQFNARLARQVHLVAGFASSVFKHLAVAKKPAYIRWISDRDAILDRYDALVYDFAYIYFLLQYGQTLDFGNLDTTSMVEKPRFILELPEKSGRHRFDELVRLPDYLAGTMADLDVENIAFTHKKFETMFKNVFFESTNNAIIQVLGDSTRVTARRLMFHAR